MKSDYITQQYKWKGESGWSHTHLMNGAASCSHTPAPRYAEEYIDYWQRIYEANRLFEQRGIRFDTFLTAPCLILNALLWSPQPQCPEEFRSLLPRQQHIATTLDKIDALRAQAEAIEAELDAKRPPLKRRNGAWHEPLKHHVRTHGPRSIPA